MASPPLRPTRELVSERVLARVNTTVQGKYRINRLLGVGGMAAVYAGTHRNGHKVAFKFLLEHLLHDSDIYRLFVREAYVANQIDHPGAVPVLDDDVDDEGCPFLIMPLLEGETLRARWERMGKRLPLEEVCVFMLDVLDVLAAAHAKGVVHRDIKPENLFLTTKGEVRVLDFGIARRSDGDGSTTIAGRMIGTPAFMPPEQALGDREAIGPRSDLWAVGATMFALLSGEFVHRAESAAAQLAAAATKRARSLADAAPGLPATIAGVVDKALALAPADRWPSTNGMRLALIDALEAATAEPAASIATHVRALVGEALSAQQREDYAFETQPPRRLSQGELQPASDADMPSVAPASPPTSVPLPLPNDPGAPITGPEGKNLPAPTVPAAGTRSITSRKNSRKWTFALGLLAAIALGAAAFRGTPGSTVHRAPDADETSPSSSNPVAQAELNAGIQNLRDAAKWTAEKHFAHAIELDPTLAAAHLYSISVPPWPNDAARAHHHAAMEHRAHLKARELALLEAYAPAMLVPPNLRESEQRLSDAHKAFPEDWLIARTLAYTQIQRNRITEALVTIEELLTRDPSLAMAWSDKAIALSEIDNIPATRDSFNQCLQISPYGEKCLEMLMNLESHEGNCAEFERYSRMLLSVPSPISPAATLLATAIQSRGAPMASVRGALDDAWKLAPESKRDIVRLQNETSVRVLEGNFAGADETLADWSKAIANVMYEEEHGRWAKMQFYAAMELDERDKAAQLASEFLAQRDAWLSSPYFDFEILPLRVLYLTGAISRASYRQRRDAWLARDESAHPEFLGLPSLRWMLSYALAVATPEDAEEALAALPRYGITNTITRGVDSDDGIGVMYMLVGDMDKSLRYLRRGAGSCRALDYPFEDTWAHLHLGMALERTGNVAEACSEYATVLTRWGREPRSVSAKTALDRRTVLRCSPLTR